jgi:hypothetical protein
MVTSHSLHAIIGSDTRLAAWLVGASAQISGQLTSRLLIDG